MAGKTAHSLEAVLAAIETGCTKANTAKLLGVTWQTMDNYAHRWKAVETALACKRREIVDYAEGGLRLAVLRGEPVAVAFALKTLGKEQGYTERTEVTGPEGGGLSASLR